MNRGFVFMLGIFWLCLGAFSQYVPPRGNDWQSRPPGELGFNEKKLANAIQFAEKNEYSGDRDLRIAILKGFAHEPYHDVLGPTKKRGGPAGMILRNGYVVAQWGDIDRVDMTFSVTKSYLSTVAGLAVDAGLIADVRDRAAAYVWDGTFEGEHNGRISWHHLLNQSSDWSGTLFGGKDWADRPPREGGIDEWKYRELREPGTFFEYNDVRVNVLAYALLQVWRQPLPMVLKEKIMDPIGASTTWRWYGYDHAWTTIDGLKVQSVTGGGHSGGGLFISARDQARFGLLFLRDGRWGDQQLVSGDWIKAARQPSEANESYGYMWWLNRGERKWDGVDDDSIYYAAGFGGNFIVVDEANDLVIVARWLEPSQIGQFVRQVRESLSR
ncbi:MAG: beta-lactamase family protein [Cyclobacteriaceae bacterium]|nr:beta-lactamase family protein [Cyclobacteriaceae bacterium]